MHFTPKIILLFLLMGLCSACDQLGECNAQIETQIELPADTILTENFSLNNVSGQSIVLDSTCPAYPTGFTKNHNFREIEKNDENLIIRIGRQQAIGQITASGIEPIEKTESHLGCEISTTSTGTMNESSLTINFITQVAVTGVTCELAAQL